MPGPPEIVELNAGQGNSRDRVALPEEPVDPASFTERARPLPPLIVGPDSFTLSDGVRSSTYKLNGILELGSEGLVPALLWATLLSVHDLNQSFRRIVDQTEAAAAKAGDVEVGDLAAKTFAAMAKQFPGLVPPDGAEAVAGSKPGTIGPTE